MNWRHWWSRWTGRFWRARRLRGAIRDTHSRLEHLAADHTGLDDDAQ